MKNSLKGLVAIVSLLLVVAVFVLLCIGFGPSFFLACVGLLMITTLIGICWLIGDMLS